MRRRVALAGLASGAALLAGCGFVPRGAPKFNFQRLALIGFGPDSPIRNALNRQLARQSLVLTERPQAQVVLEVLREDHNKIAVVSTAAGQVREWQLQLALDYRLLTPGDELLLPRTELRLTRDLTTTESAALAKEREEMDLRRAMLQDAVALLLRRLAAVKPQA